MKINGSTQIQNNTVSSGQVDSSLIVAAGSNAFTGDQSMGSHKLTSLSAPVSATDAATKGYVDTLAQGLSATYSAVASTNTETLTISSGNVTQIAGTTVDGISPNVDDYVLIMNAPSSTGAAAGTALSTQPGNGLYQVTSNTTNLSVSRAAEMSGSLGPFGAYVFVVSGPTWGTGGFVVTTPAATGAFTYGTNNIGFTQFSGAGSITSDSTLVITGNQVKRAAISGDVTVASGSNTSAIASSAVTLGKMANLAANSVIGNATGSSATPAAVTLATAATASSVAYRNSNGDLAANAFIEGIATTATAAGTTTLTAASGQFQQFTGTTTQNVKLPDATTLSNGRWFWIANRSTGVVTVQYNDASTLQAMASGTFALVTLISNGSSNGTWDNGYISGTGTVTSTSVATANGFSGTVATSTTTPAITIQTTITGVLKGNGTAISAAAAGTDYMAPSSFITREAPSGTINGSTTAFTLANTPITGTEMVYQNGLLLRAGASYDYTISGVTITFNAAPQSGEYISVSYQK